MFTCLVVLSFFFFLMSRRPPDSTRTDTPLPYTTRFRSAPTDPGLAIIADAVLADPSEATRLEDWAGRLGVSARTLRRRVQAETGLSYRDWRRILGLTRSEEHTSELQSLMRISYAVFCLKKNKSTHQSRMHNQYHDI